MIEVLTKTVSRWLLLPTLVIAVAILVKGYAGVGDGFSAGVIVALGVLIQYVALGYRQAEQLVPMRLRRICVCGGLLLALGVAFFPVTRGDAIFTHYPVPGQKVVHIGSLELHTAMAFDLGIFLLVFASMLGIISAIAQAQEELKGGEDR